MVIKCKNMYENKYQKCGYKINLNYNKDLKYGYKIK